MIHELKCIDPYFAHVALGLKTFEVRKNDRDFNVGDVLLLSRLRRDGLTGERVRVDVVHVLEGGAFGIADGYCVLGIRDPVILESKDKNAHKYTRPSPVVDRSLSDGAKWCALVEASGIQGTASARSVCDLLDYIGRTAVRDAAAKTVAEYPYWMERMNRKPSKVGDAAQDAETEEGR
jgi:hypothetical protein